MSRASSLLRWLMGAGGRPRAAALLLLALLLASCGPKPPIVRPYPPPTPAELAAEVASRRATVRSMNARARATSWLGGDRVRATVLMLVTRAGQLRFEAEVSLQGTVATLAADSEHFALLDVPKNELRIGPACPANVASLIRIPLAPAEIASILLGDVDLDSFPGDAGTISWDATRGADIWTLPAPTGATHLAFQGSAGERTLIGVARDRANGQRLWQTAYEDFARSSAGGPRLPSVIRFAEGNSSFDDGVEIQFKDRTLNVTPKPEDFVLRAPPGVAVREVGCGSGG